MVGFTTIMAQAGYESRLYTAFPYITQFNSTPTSPQSIEYNCIAWAYGRNDAWFWPDTEQQYYWPLSRRERSLDVFMELFSSVGYSQCEDASQESGFLKIALYVDEGEKPTHAARQLPTGKWTSKLGNDIDIEHDGPEVLNGPTYGTVKVFMKKRIPVTQ